MTEQEQNEAICEWLGWLPQIDDDGSRVWWVKDARGMLETPTFRTGNDAQLMFERLEQLEVRWTLDSNCFVEKYRMGIATNSGDWLKAYGPSVPDVVRAAVLSHIEAQS